MNLTTVNPNQAVVLKQGILTEFSELGGVSVLTNFLFVEGDQRRGKIVGATRPYAFFTESPLIIDWGTETNGVVQENWLENIR